MLRRIKNDSVFPVDKIPYEKEYTVMTHRLKSQGHYNEVLNFLEEKINDVDSFSCGTMFPMTNLKAWKGPLQYVFLAAGSDVTLAGYFLGLLVMNIIIESQEDWLGTTTNITGREFETMFYWKAT